MTGPEKAVVAVSFVTLAFALQLQFDPLGSVTDHLSYIAFFFSYAIGNPIAFRIIAMVASVFEIISGAEGRHITELGPGAYVGEVSCLELTGPAMTASARIAMRTSAAIWATTMAASATTPSSAGPSSSATTARIQPMPFPSPNTMLSPKV